MAEGLQYWDKMVAQARGSRAEHLANTEVYALGVRAVMFALVHLEANSAASEKRPNEILSVLVARNNNTLDHRHVIASSNPDIGSVKLEVYPHTIDLLTVDTPSQDERSVRILTEPVEEVTVLDAERVAVAANTAFNLLAHYQTHTRAEDVIKQLFLGE